MRLWPFGHKAKPAADLTVGQPAILAVLPWRPASSGDNANSSVAQLTANMTAYVNLVESLRGRKVRVIGMSGA
jgi:adenylosuccinate synthase